MSTALDKFGEFVATTFRDAGIDYADALLAAGWKAPGLQRLQADLSQLDASQRAIVRRCVVAAVDRALHDFLFALQEQHDAGAGIAILVDGRQVAADSDGLHGELFSDEGWFARFSKHGPHPEPA